MPREHPTLETCALCGTSLPNGYPYDLCAICRTKCTCSTGCIHNHEYVSTLAGGCVCRFCGMKIDECFRGLKE